MSHDQHQPPPTVFTGTPGGEGGGRGHWHCPEDHRCLHSDNHRCCHMLWGKSKKKLERVNKQCNILMIQMEKEKFVFLLEWIPGN